MNLELLIKLSPLVVATLHGYGAAWLAVRMLFRPRLPIYLFGKRLPLTPGLLPKERDRFITALSGMIANRLLNIEVLSAELAKLDLATEITALAQREYAKYTNDDAALRSIARHLGERLDVLSRDEAAKRAMAVRLHGIIDRETVDAGFFRRLAAGYLMDVETLEKLIGKGLESAAEGVTESEGVRKALRETLTQVPQKLLTNGTQNALISPATIASLVETLSRKLDIRAILLNRLNAFSNQDIENLVMETAGREINAIVWFGAAIGLIVGIFQTLINFL
ncbi:MAG: DUF445 family protein [Acidobacteria bacterium]|nr:DUF445 family protein [Acidobacteriota bacterium]